MITVATVLAAKKRNAVTRATTSYVRPRGWRSQYYLAGATVLDARAGSRGKLETRVWYGTHGTTGLQVMRASKV